jgi:peroxiredoxin
VIRVATLILIFLALSGTGLAQLSPPADVLNSDIKDLRGESFRLSEGSSKAKIIFICASWARLCDFAAKDMNKFQKSYSKRGVAIIGLTNENPTVDYVNVRKFIRRNKIKFKVGWMDAEMEKTLTDAKHPGLVPIVIVLNEQHNVDSKFIGYSIRETPSKLIAVLNRLTHK